MSWVSKWKVDEAQESSPAGTMVSSALHGPRHENMSHTTQHPHPNYRWHHIDIAAICLILDYQLNIGIGLNFPRLPCPPLTPITKAHWVLLVVRLQQFNGFVSNICISRIPHRIQRTWLRTPGDVQHLLISTLEPVARSIQKSYFDGTLGKWTNAWIMANCGLYPDTNIKMIQKSSKIQKDKVEKPKHPQAHTSKAKSCRIPTKEPLYSQYLYSSGKKNACWPARKISCQVIQSRKVRVAPEAVLSPELEVIYWCLVACRTFRVFVRKAITLVLYTVR